MNDTNEIPLHIQQANGLRKLAEMIENNPALAPLIKTAISGMNVSVGHRSPAQADLAAFLRAGGKAARKNYDSDKWMAVNVDLGAVSLYVYAAREEVCERVVTGTETVTKTVPDPAKLAEVPTVEVTEVVETVEWVCKPLLAAEKDPAVAR